MASSDSEILVDALKRTRESLEELLARLRQSAEIREPTITEEKHGRRAKRAIRKITNDYLPWARLKSLRADRASEIAFWLNGLWASLPLDE